MSLILSEIIGTICYLVIYLFAVLVISGKAIITFADFLYADLIMAAVALFPAYMSMIYIAGDKVLGIVWNIMYPLHWNTEKAKYLILSTWMIGVVMAVSFCVAIKFAPRRYIPPLGYFILTLDRVFVLLAVLSNCYFFYNYVHTRRHR